MTKVDDFLRGIDTDIFLVSKKFRVRFTVENVLLKRLRKVPEDKGF